MADKKEIRLEIQPYSPPPAINFNHEEILSSVKEREPVRISKEAVNSNISFSNIGSELIRAYKTREEVEAVKIYFITSDSADYKMLKQFAGRCEQITDSLNHIFNGLVMDCSTCSSRGLCDEIEDLRKYS